MDGEQVVAAHKFMREHHLRLAAIFHSHPSSPPTLSRTDQEEALYPDSVLLVVSFATEPPEAAAWRIDTRDSDTHIVEVPIIIEEA
jgi:proteasome lid subunit RPN8/RPN11